MNFVDEAEIRVVGGKGGDGCLGFRREKYIAFGGPNGGDGGDGGNVYLLSTDNLNTLVDFRFKKKFPAKNGRPGEGSNCTGRSGEDLDILVPVGTEVWDKETCEKIGDLKKAGERLLVAKGGEHGLGNARFKTSTNRAPRKTTPGRLGENRILKLELKVLADVGLLGMPNAGKSTLISTISAAKPKVADYPFTTLHPNLGVVKVSLGESFVVADIPGLIKGAASGVGLGISFLKHLSRTKLLLHIVDVGQDADKCITDIKDILEELKQYSDDLFAKPRWLVLNKTDLIANDVVQEVKQYIVKELGWQEPVFCISGVSGDGVKPLLLKIMQYVLSENL